MKPPSPTKNTISDPRMSRQKPTIPPPLSKDSAKTPQIINNNDRKDLKNDPNFFVDQ